MAYDGFNREVNTGGQLHQPALPTAAAPRGTDNRAMNSMLRPADTRHPLMMASDRLAHLTRSDSPLMRQARSQADRMMQGRGLLSSSMAQGARQDAAYRAALPVALSEAEQANKAAMQARDQDFRREHDVTLQEGRFGHEQTLQSMAADRTAQENLARRTWEGRQNELNRQLERYGIDAKVQLGELDLKMKQLGIRSEFASRLFGSIFDSIGAAMSTGQYGSDEIAGMVRGSANSMRYLMDVIGGIMGTTIPQGSA